MTTNTLAQDLQSYQNKRRFPDWQPVEPDLLVRKIPDNAFAHMADEVVQRCLDFIGLELTVADWVTDAAIPEEAKPYFDRNAQDEEKHLRVLNMLSRYYEHDCAVPHAEPLLRMWRNLPGNKITNAYALEMGVFFCILPTLNKYGDTYASAVSGWINDDERVHVESALRLMRHMGWKITNEHAMAVGRTVKYIYGPMGEKEATEQAKRAIKRLLTARDATMSQDSVPVTIAFFEQLDRGSIVY